MPKEIEIKFRITDIKALIRALKSTGFEQVTRSTHEINSLYDLPGQNLRKRGELLRLRKYGKQWVLTHKKKSTLARKARKDGAPDAGRHKVRTELETRVENGEQMDAVLRALGFSPTFRYEKYRAEWSDGTAHAVIDETPIGNFGELEGPARWIDRTARALGITPRDYLTQTYADLFFTWKRKNRSPASEMTFSAIPAKYRDAR
ncbi:MAG: class IV adenylate cyclase [Terriglobales bacterium]